LLSAFARPALADGPGIPAVTFTDAQLFKPLSVIHSDISGSARGHGNVAMVNGYLFVPFARDEGKAGGGLSFYDLTDPAHPSKVSQVNVNHVREPHGFGFMGSICALQSTVGIMMWDFSNPLSPSLLRELALPNTAAEDYDHAAWWVFYQAPWIYVGGGLNGVHIINASNPSNPTRVKTISAPFRVGSTFAVGNLLVIMANDRAGLATYDISDPVNPHRFISTSGVSAQYSGVVNGDKIITSGNDNRLHVYDISDPLHITHLVDSPTKDADNNALSKGGYPSVQDGFAHSGFSSRYAKISIADGVIAHTGTSGITNRDEDFGTVLGNLVFVGSDHPVGSALIPHQAAPDTTPPAVTMVSPKTGATGQGLKSRVGVSFSDQIDFRSVTASTFIVRRQGGAQLAGSYSVQGAIVNFGPASPLEPGATYELSIPAGGVKDVAGNKTSTAFASTFTTAGGASIITNLSVKDAANAADWSVQSNLQVGNLVYGDRTYTFSAIPSGLLGSAWVKTANDSKTSTLNPLATFTVAANATVSLALNKSQPVPSWVDSTWMDTGTVLTTRESSTTTRTFEIFARDFDAAATVTLGPWNSSSSIYTVIAKPR
jgi:hypothetical protein